MVRGRGEEKLILAEHGRKVHQLLGDFTLFKQRLQVLEERVAQLESCLVKLMKTLSESEE